MADKYCFRFKYAIKTGKEEECNDISFTDIISDSLKNAKAQLLEYLRMSEDDIKIYMAWQSPSKTV